MSILYLDIFSGISGDMFLGALIDLGADFQQLQQELAKLGLSGYNLHASRQQRAHITGTKFDVHLSVACEQAAGPGHELAPIAGSPAEVIAPLPSYHQQVEVQPEQMSAHRPSRTFAQIQQLIQASALSAWVREKAVAVFRRIAVAEGKIHDRPPDQVHFHEVGAVDSIIDIVGAGLALELLGKPRLMAASVVEGTGWVDCAHGRFPLPTPATLAILGTRGIPISQCDEPYELVTPTGAALLAEFVEQFGPMQNLVTSKVGYGLGARENRTRPNVLRAILSEETAEGLDWERDTIAVLETNLDDINAEILGCFVEQALAAGALDVFHTPIQMKKNRPAVLLTVLCAVDQARQFTELMLRETSAFGVRQQVVERRKLQRELKNVDTPYGAVTVKLGKLNGRIVQAAPEFESCKAAALRAKVPLKQIYQVVNLAIHNQL
jgi:uncharacterized protein (TIGR00299 family) protein